MNQIKMKRDQEDGESKEDYRRRVIAWYTQKNLRAKLKEKERATHIFDHLMDERINHEVEN
jgi:hypothetical protein